MRCWGNHRIELGILCTILDKNHMQHDKQSLKGFAAHLFDLSSKPGGGGGGDLWYQRAIAYRQ